MTNTEALGLQAAAFLNLIDQLQRRIAELEAAQEEPTDGA